MLNSNFQNSIEMEGKQDAQTTEDIHLRQTMLLKNPEMGKARQTPVKSTGPLYVPGCFTPTLLTILGRLIYVPGLWVVGNAGLVGAIGIISLTGHHFFTFFCRCRLSSPISDQGRRGTVPSFPSPWVRISGVRSAFRSHCPIPCCRSHVRNFRFQEGWFKRFPGHTRCWSTSALLP